MQERGYSTIVNYVECGMTQQIVQDHFAFGEHQIFLFICDLKKQSVANQLAQL